MIEKLLSISEPWLQYAIKIHLLNESKESLTDLKNEALRDEKVQAYLRDVSDFHSMLVSNHKNPELPIHKLLFLLDIGFDMDMLCLSTKKCSKGAPKSAAPNQHQYWMDVYARKRDVREAALGTSAVFLTLS